MQIMLCAYQSRLMRERGKAGAIVSAFIWNLICKQERKRLRLIKIVKVSPESIDFSGSACYNYLCNIGNDSMYYIFLDCKLIR